MNDLDMTIVFIIAISTVAAVGRGIVIELLSLTGLVMGLILAGKYYSEAAEKLMVWLHIQALADMAGFLVIVVGTLLFATWLGHYLHRLAKYSGLGWLDSLLGAVFGFVRGAVAVTAAMMALAAFMPQNTWTTHSHLAPYFFEAAGKASVIVPPPLAYKIDSGIWTLRQLMAVRLWI